MNDRDWLDDLAKQDLSEQLEQDAHEQYLHETDELQEEKKKPNVVLLRQCTWDDICYWR